MSTDGPLATVLVIPLEMADAVIVDLTERRYPHDDVILAVKRLTFEREALVRLTLFGADIVVGPFDAGGYTDVWSYSDPPDALRALAGWDGLDDPVGWVRHAPSMRRREGGDPATERIAR